MVEKGATSKGIVYAATGKKYLKEAERSALSVKKHMSGVPITLFTDVTVPNDVFDNIVFVDDIEQWRNGKLYAISHAPYHLNIFLDTDTLVCADISNLFLLLDSFDLAICHSEFPHEFIYEIPRLKAVGDAFPELNSGLMAFRNTGQWQRFSSEWVRLFRTKREERLKMNLPKTSDQPAFRDALYQSNLRYQILPLSYNCPLWAGHLGGKVKVIHSRYWNIDLAEKILNSTQDLRVFVNKNENIHLSLYKPKKYSARTMRLFQYLVTLQHRGIKEVIQLLLQAIKRRVTVIRPETKEKQ